MSQNIVRKGSDNPIRFVFNFKSDFGTTGLVNFSRITLELGDEVYSTDLTPDNLVVTSVKELQLSIGDTTSLKVGYYDPIITGYNPSYDDGYVLTPKEGCGKLAPIKVIMG